MSRWVDVTLDEEKSEVGSLVVAHMPSIGSVTYVSHHGQVDATYLTQVWN